MMKGKRKSQPLFQGNSLAGHRFLQSFAAGRRALPACWRFGDEVRKCDFGAKSVGCLETGLRTDYF